MANFHRLIAPVYAGGLRAGDDYINNAAAGTPAPADTVLVGGTYAGSYFFIDGQVTAAAVNRGLKALAQNCDFLDDGLVAVVGDAAAYTDLETARALAAEAAEVSARTTAVALRMLTSEHDALRTLTAAATLHNPARDATVILNPAASFALQLPNPSTCSGQRVELYAKNAGIATNIVTLTRFGAELINGLAGNYALSAAFGRWILTTDGTDWYVLSA